MGVNGSSLTQFMGRLLCHTANNIIGLPMIVFWATRTICQLATVHLESASIIWEIREICRNTQLQNVIKV